MRKIFFVVIFCFQLSFAQNPINTDIPKILWQTYKTKTLPPQAEDARSSWVCKNPEFEFQLYDDSDIENFIRNNFDPSYLEFYHQLPLGVMKADLWRYLIILKEGGYYTDIDTQCYRSILKWPIKIRPEDFPNGVLLVSIEPADLPFFCQWTFAATKNHPALAHVCSYIVENFKKNGINTSNPHFVHGTTGPSIWTQALLDYLGLPTDLHPKELLFRYLKDPIFKDCIHQKGLIPLPSKFFNGYASSNLYGGDTFDDDYIGWKKELRKLQNKN